MTMPTNNSKNWTIFDRRILFITVPLETGLLLLSILIAYAAHQAWHWGFFADVLIFYTALMGLTLITLKIIRILFPPIDGRFNQTEHPQVIYIWGLMNFLSMTNLFLHYQNSLLPSPIRKFLIQMLGAKIGKGIINISGFITDPYAVTIEEGALIGADSLILPHMYTGSTLIRRRITIGHGSVIGARSILMPGVTVGKGSMIKAMSVVAEGTNIPPNEIWGGIPARKMGEQPVTTDATPTVFSTWRDMIISPLIEIVLLTLSGYGAWHLTHYFKFKLFGGIILFYCLLVTLTLITLKIMRWLWSFREGTYSFKNHPWVCYRWNLHGFLCIMNLFLHYQNGLLSPILRRIFGQTLGTKLTGQHNAIPMSGLILDPFMIEMNAASIICNEVLIAGHIMTQNALILRPVKIEANALIQPRSLIMPGATIEQGARVGHLSLVTVGTHIKTGESWLGVPARKIGEDQEVDLQKATSPIFKLNGWDIFLTATLRITIFAVAILGTLAFSPLWWGDGFIFLVIFHICDVFTALTALWILRQLFKFKPGIYTQKNNPEVIRNWILCDTILASNLKLYYLNCLLPPHLRTAFLKLLGLQSRKNSIVVGGLIFEPYLVKIGNQAIIGLDALLTPAQLTNDSLILGQIEIKDRAFIGHRAVILPNVIIGEGAIVESMSLVLSGTTIPPFEIWGGIPAKKIGEVP